MFEFFVWIFIIFEALVVIFPEHFMKVEFRKYFIAGNLHNGTMDKSELFMAEAEMHNHVTYIPIMIMSYIYAFTCIVWLFILPLKSVFCILGLFLLGYLAAELGKREFDNSRNLYMIIRADALISVFLLSMIL